jgi:outer membrane protein assembly factor BamB
VNPGGPNGNGVVAYDRATGEKRWSAGHDIAAYSSPTLAVLEGERQLLIFDGVGLAGHNPETGAELWKFNWTNSPHINVAQPIAVDDRHVFIGSGYAQGSALVEVTRASTGWKCVDRWQSTDFKLKFNNAVLRNGYLYGLDEGILVCLDARDGNRQWKRGRYGYGQILLVDDLLLIEAESGEMVLVETTPDAHRELARFSAIEGISWNAPVLCRGRLLVRNSNEAACYDLR